MQPDPTHNKRPVFSSRGQRLRSVIALVMVGSAFVGVGGQLIRLAWQGQHDIRASRATPLATAFSRPDIVDRNGHLMATDVVMPSLYADPAVIIDADEATETLVRIFPDLDARALQKRLSDRKRRFIWIKRGLSPRLAQKVHDAGLPGLGFRSELRRAYPSGRLAGHALGHVNVDNKGMAGLEKYLDGAGLVDPVHAAVLSQRPPVRLSLDVGVQHGLEDELGAAMARYDAKAAAGLVLDVQSGEIVAAASLPGVDPLHADEWMDEARRDRIRGSVYELGSVFKAFTLALAFDDGIADFSTRVDVATPLVDGKHSFSDERFGVKTLNASSIFLRSSNVGAARLALRSGAVMQRIFFERVGLVGSLHTEAGTAAAPIAPARWGRLETITLAFGHGLAIAPVQFAAAAAGLINGGRKIEPTFLKSVDSRKASARVIRTDTSAMIRQLMRRNVVDAAGTAKLADVPGYRVGGKTGTAEIPGRGGYRRDAVIASFLGAFPMDDPAYLTFVMLFEPKPTAAAQKKVTAGYNAAPTTARLIERIGPLVGVASEPTLN